MKTPDEIKKGLECCAENGNCSNGCPYNPIRDCGDALYHDALALIQQLEAALMLMVYQYCQYDGKLEHYFMCAGEQAFKVLGLEEGAGIETLEKMMDEARVW